MSSRFHLNPSTPIVVVHIELVDNLGFKSLSHELVGNLGFRSLSLELNLGGGKNYRYRESHGIVYRVIIEINSTPTLPVSVSQLLSTCEPSNETV